MLWLHTGTAARFEQSVRDIADETKIYGRRDPKANIFELVRNWLRDASKGRWVIVLDNVDDASFFLAPPASVEQGRSRRLIDYIPACEHGSVLITTRSKSVAWRMVPSSQVIEISPMENRDAQSLLEKKLGVDDGGNYARLATALDCLPLAMAQAAAYIHERSPRCSVEQYLQELEQSGRSRTSLLRRDERFPDRDYDKASSSILVTWQISFEHIAETRRSAADLLSVMSFCDRQAIPETLVRGDDKAKGDDVGFEDDVTMLRNFSFISPTADPSSWEMHRLVQDATRMWLEDRNMHEEFQDSFLGRLNQVLPYSSYENWTRSQVLFPHAERAADSRPSRTQALLDWATVMDKAAFWAYLQGQWAKAEGMAKASLKERTSILGEHDEQTVKSTAMLGLMVRQLGRLKEAEQLQVKVIEARELTLRIDHPDTLTSMAELARTYWCQERWMEAGQLEVKVIKKRQATLGLNHPDTLKSMANLATTYRDEGRLTEAELLDLEVLQRS